MGLRHWQYDSSEVSLPKHGGRKLSLPAGRVRQAVFFLFLLLKQKAEETATTHMFYTINQKTIEPEPHTVSSDCQVDPAVIQDLAGTPFPGLLENDFRSLDVNEGVSFNE